MFTVCTKSQVHSGVDTTPENEKPCRDRTPVRLLELCPGRRARSACRTGVLPFRGLRWVGHLCRSEYHSTLPDGHESCRFLGRQQKEVCRRFPLIESFWTRVSFLFLHSPRPFILGTPYPFSSILRISPLLFRISGELLPDVPNFAIRRLLPLVDKW